VQRPPFVRTGHGFHDHVVQVYGYCELDARVGIVMELCMTDLYRHLAKRTRNVVLDDSTVGCGAPCTAVCAVCVGGLRLRLPERCSYHRACMGIIRTWCVMAHALCWLGVAYAPPPPLSSQIACAGAGPWLSSHVHADR
jgi:hypothetical protein